jgi:hypothetical protein
MTSTRNPSTPRRIQKRRTSCMASRTAVAPVQVRLLLEKGVVVILPGGSSNSHALPPKLLIQLLGGPPSGAGSRQMYQSRFSLSRAARLSMNHGCSSDVWLGT